MSAIVTNSLANDRINSLLINVGRSLLQYTSECWPWTGSGDDQIRRDLDRMAAEQRDVVAALADLLARRGQVIDFGTYPTEYTSLHYVAVDFLLRQIVANQRALAAECEQVARATSPDDDARPLLDDIALSERRHLDELQAIIASRPQEPHGIRSA